MTLRDLFAINRDIILFIYGQVFFVTGLAIALQSRRYSRLDLARSLQWLAAFGIVHGLHEWGDLFIPLQAVYLNQPWVRALNLAHLITLGISFACLFEFGVSLLRSFAIKRLGVVLRWSPLAVLLIWLGAIFFLLLPVMPNFAEWQRTANALARYLIGFPSALLAAYGLRRHALERIAPLGVPHIVWSLRVAGFALALYAMVGGLIVPPVPFFPGNWLNTTTFFETTGLPVLLFRSVIGLALAVTIIRTLEVFDVETGRIIEAMEQQQILVTERDRIGRELHDGAIQLVYTAGLLVESAHTIAPLDTPIANRLERAISVLKDAISALRRNLGELRVTPSATSVADGLKQLAGDPRFSSFVDVSLQCEMPSGDPLSPVRVEHILAIVNEAMSNVVRHAHARKALITANCNRDRLRVTIQDDGVGLPKELQAGYGLRNMRDRARLLGGTLDVSDANRHGTIVTLDVPWKDER
ncbi:MAG: histidine kinase [Chloroflexi bacterium]|nr:histidine kinase [Chloroflexota bacterium]